MNYKVIEKPSFDIIEKVETHTIENDNNLKSIPEFWSRAKSDGTIDTLCGLSTDKSYIFGVCYGNQSNESLNFDYSIATIIDSNTKIPKGFRRNTISAKTWIVFECVGAMPTAIQEMWNKIITEFFPTSAYEPTFEMDIEAYKDGDMDSNGYHCEIWVPVVKK